MLMHPGICHEPQKKGSRNSLYLVSNQSSGVTTRKVTGVLMLNKKSVRYCSLRGLIQTFREPSRNFLWNPLLRLSRTFPPNLCWNFLRTFAGTCPKSTACVYPMFILIWGSFVSLNKKTEKRHVTNFGFWICYTKVRSNALKHKPVREFKYLNKSGYAWNETNRRGCFNAVASSGNRNKLRHSIGVSGDIMSR